MNENKIVYFVAGGWIWTADNFFYLFNVLVVGAVLGALLREKKRPNWMFCWQLVSTILGRFSLVSVESLLDNKNDSSLNAIWFG